MKVLLIAALLMAGVASISATEMCETNCNTYCGVFSAMCNANPFLPLLGMTCEPISAGCSSTCDTVFCPCLDNAMAACDASRTSCRTGGAVDVFCQFEFDGCMVIHTAQCFGQVGATVLAGVLQTITSLIPSGMIGAE